MVMEPKYLSEEVNYTPQSSSDKVIGSLGKGVKNDFFNFVSTCNPFSPFFYLQKEGLFQSKQGSFGLQVSPGLFFSCGQ